MIRPAVFPGMKKSDDLAGLRIDRRQVGTLTPIAERTAQRQIRS
jgi:hypothetical protein